MSHCNGEHTACSLPGAPCWGRDAKAVRRAVSCTRGCTTQRSGPRDGVSSRCLSGGWVGGWLVGWCEDVNELHQQCDQRACVGSSCNLQGQAHVPKFAAVLHGRSQRALTSPIYVLAVDCIRGFATPPSNPLHKQCADESRRSEHVCVLR